MAYTMHIPLSTFKEVSNNDKARALTMFGTLLATTTAFDVNFFLYSIDNYFVEVTSKTESGDVMYIRATEFPDVMDLYLSDIELTDLKAN